MKYAKLIGKLDSCQKKIKEGIANDPKVESIPTDLDEKCRACDEWLSKADIKLGEAEVPSKTPDIDPLLDYTNALDEYSGLFSEKVQSHITQFDELVKELFDEVKA